MRVTKVMREYIAEEVSKKFQKMIEETKANSISTKKEQEFNNRVNELRERWEKEFSDLMEEYDIVACWQGRDHVRVDNCGCNLRHEKGENLDQTIRKLKERERIAIQQIQLQLELNGASLLELNNLIDNAWMMGEPRKEFKNK